MASLPLLKEVYICGGIGGYTKIECHITLPGISFAKKTSTVNNPHNWSTQSTTFSERGEEMLRAVWEILSKRTIIHVRRLDTPSTMKAFATTPILTLGLDRRHISRRSRLPPNTGLFARGAVPDFIFGGLGTVKDIRFHRNLTSPELLIGTAWYSWDAIFSSNRLTESHSMYYVLQAVHRFRKKYVSWVYYSGTSKGRRHGDRTPQNKLINCLWRLNWQDKKAKLGIMGELYKARHYRHSRGY